MESHFKDAKIVAIKRCKTTLDDAFSDFFHVPFGAANANGKPGRDDSVEGEESSDRSEYGVDPPDIEPAPGAVVPAAPAAPAAPLPLAVPGDAALSPAEKQEAPREQASAEYVIPEFATGGQ